MIQVNFTGVIVITRKYRFVSFLSWLPFAMVLAMPLQGFSSSAERNCPSYLRPQHGAQAEINCLFHQEYENEIQRLLDSFGKKNGRPVILNLGGTLILKQNGMTKKVDLTPNIYHQNKSISHAIFTIYLLLARQQHNHPLKPEVQKLVRTLLSHLIRAKQELDKDETSMPLILISGVYLEGVLKHEKFNQQAFIRYFSRIKPALEKAIQFSTSKELNLLDKTVNAWVANMTREESEALSIVVAVPHQARAQEVSLQYFAKKFQMHFSEGAIGEDKVIVLEGKFDEQSALQLLARHILDRDAAKIILNNPEDLQRDLLADAARDWLQKQGQAFGRI